MKKVIKLMIVSLLLSAFTTSCKEDQEKYPTYESPIWVVSSENNVAYYVNMTAVVTLPEYLKKYAQPEDKFAAFAADECRGVGNIVDGKYYVTIKGTPENNAPIHFKYYSARTKYMYKTAELFIFEVEKIFGTPDAPEQPKFDVIK
jgi:hypothetical protein